MLFLWVGKSVVVEVRNNYTWGAEAGLGTNEIVSCVVRYERNGERLNE